jgi:hypothetical protein
MGDPFWQPAVHRHLLAVLPRQATFGAKNRQKRKASRPAIMERIESGCSANILMSEVEH